MIAKEVMKKVFTVNKDITLKEAAKIMTKKRTVALVFVQKDKIKGMVTKSDLLNNFGKDTTISKIMRKNVPTVSEDEEVSRIKSKMKTNDIYVVPVFRDNELVGIVKENDILGVDDEEEEFLFN